MKNLKFIPKEVPWFGISMVVQDINYKEIPQFIKLRDTKQLILEIKNFYYSKNLLKLKKFCLNKIK